VEEVEFLKDWEKKYHSLIKELRDLLKKKGYPDSDFELVRNILLETLRDVKEYLAYYSDYEWGFEEELE